MIEIYNRDEKMAIRTDCDDERAFTEQLANLVSQMIHDGVYMAGPEADWKMIFDALNEAEEIRFEKGKEFVLMSTGTEKIKYNNGWFYGLKIMLPLIVDIVCKYRGYKNGVEAQQVLLSGNKFMIQDQPLAALREIEDK